MRWIRQPSRGKTRGPHMRLQLLSHILLQCQDCGYLHKKRLEICLFMSLQEQARECLAGGCARNGLNMPHDVRQPDICFLPALETYII